MAQVEVRNVVKSFGRHKPVLHDISFAVPEHTFFTLLGPSGCGKTTLLRIIAGLENPDGGAVLIGGRDVTRLPPAERNVSMVFQSYALYPHMTVFNNIATPLKLRKRTHDEVQRRVKDTADLLGISDHLNKLPSTLSGGERQRVALARALVREPAVFLMDEPLSNLDALLRERTRTELKMLFSRIGATVIYVTHDQVEAMAMSDRIVVLNNGLIQQAGSPLQIYQEPANQFVAGFVGSPRMNFLQVKARGTSLVFDSGLAFSVPQWLIDSGRDLREVATFGFRPEDVNVGHGGMEFSGEILAVEALGFQSIISVRTPEGDVKILSTHTCQDESGHICFSVPEEKILLFSEGGNRILSRT